jgi:hypothetical protein
MLAVWVPVTSAVNSVNRSMGQPDLYPFVLSSLTVEKLRFVHDLIQANRMRCNSRPPELATAPQPTA